MREVEQKRKNYKELEENTWVKCHLLSKAGALGKKGEMGWAKAWKWRSKS